MSDDKVVSNPNSFANFGKSFQEKVLQSLIVDRMWATQFIEVFDVDECLDQNYLKFVANKYIGHYKDYKEFPSNDLLTTIITDGLTNERDMVLREQCHAFMRRVVTNLDLGDLPWVKERAFTFCRQQTLKKALLSCVDVIQSEKYEKVVDIMRGAITAGSATNAGHDYNNDIDARYSETYRNVVKTGIVELDDRKILNGGLGAGEIGIIVSPTGVGKCTKSDSTAVSIQYQEVVVGDKIFYPWDMINTKRGIVKANELREDDDFVEV